MKRALLVGVNRYPLLDGNDLRGCANDVEDMAAILWDLYGFDRVKTLVDRLALREIILDALREMLRDADDGDELVFLMSCHGTQIPDSNGDESDGYDECLCPADTRMDSDEALIRDDELRAIFERLHPGANLTVITDACHSGKVTCDLFQGIKPRFLDRGCDREAKAHAADLESRWLHISGCRDNETSADATFNGRSNGALTYALIQAIKDTPNATAREIHASALAFLEKEGYDQHPVMNGCPEVRKRAIFGGV